MVKEKKNPFEGMKRKELVKFLEKAEKGISHAENEEELEEIKRDLIKSYKPMKEDRDLSNLNGKRIELLKLCNLNLQFLHRVQEARQKAAQLDYNGAHETLVNASRAMYSHPDRSFLHEWIREEIRETLAFMAEKVSELEEQNRKKAQKDHSTEYSDQTIMPGTGVRFPENKQIGMEASQEQTIRPSEEFEAFQSPFQAKTTQQAKDFGNLEIGNHDQETLSPATAQKLQQERNPSDGESEEEQNAIEINEKLAWESQSNFPWDHGPTIKPEISKETQLFPNNAVSQLNSPFSQASETIKSPFEDPFLRQETIKPSENSIKTFWKRTSESDEKTKMQETTEFKNVSNTNRYFPESRDQDEGDDAYDVKNPDSLPEKKKLHKIKKSLELN